MLKQGRAVFGADIKIVTADGREPPHDGVTTGHLMVKDPWIMANYFRNEGRSPLVSGWFPAGDIVTIDEDGYMQITDRSKDVIKPGGEWISSIDIENIAAAHPAVAGHCLHRYQTPEMGRAADRHRRAPVRSNADTRGITGVLSRQSCQMANPRRCAVRRCHTARRHRKNTEDETTRNAEGLCLAYSATRFQARENRRTTAPTDLSHCGPRSGSVFDSPAGRSKSRHTIHTP
jgi:hypothetical protein